METDDEFFEDFGAAAIPDAALEALLTRSRQNGDLELRRLVKQFQTLRHVSGLLLERIETSCSPGELEVDQVLKLARFIIRGEGAIGA